MELPFLAAVLIDLAGVFMEETIVKLFLVVLGVSALFLGVMFGALRILRKIFHGGK